MNSIIVTRHPAALEFLRSAIHPEWHRGEIEEGKMVWRTLGVEPEDEVIDSIPIIRLAAKPEDVRGKRVYGNLPLHLAAEAAEVVAIEFNGQPPRGLEYSLEEMKASGAYLATYKVARA